MKHAVFLRDHYFVGSGSINPVHIISTCSSGKGNGGEPHKLYIDEPSFTYSLNTHGFTN